MPEDLIGTRPIPFRGINILFPLLIWIFFPEMGLSRKMTVEIKSFGSLTKFIFLNFKSISFLIELIHHRPDFTTFLTVVCRKDWVLRIYKNRAYKVYNQLKSFLKKSWWGFWEWFCISCNIYFHLLKKGLLKMEHHHSEHILSRKIHLTSFLKFSRFTSSYGMYNEGFNKFYSY